METFSFRTSAEFIRWAERIVKYKYQSFDRTPVGKQTWTYGDGHVAETEFGKAGGTMLGNLAFMVKTGTRKLAHAKEAQIVSDIDSRGGAALTIHWDD